MTDKKTMAIGIGALLLLVNLGLIVTGFVDGQIESTVESAVSDGMDGMDDDGNMDYTYDYDEDWLNVSGEKAYFANSISNPCVPSCNRPVQRRPLNNLTKSIWVNEFVHLRE